MIVTRSWLNEFVDISGISDEELYRSFNAIGLEVDSIKSYAIPSKVVVGKIVTCEKHPDADKLTVCQIDVGEESTKQIVCGAANIVEAEFVAVATIGALLPGDFEIKFATLRGVDSEGMVCASSELGLPDTGKGIMILDESIGKLEVGRELSSYDKVADTIIELELTANRGDCLSIHGVARDLSVALERELKHFEYQKSSSKVGIARFADIQTDGKIDADLYYNLIKIDQLQSQLLITLRLAMVGIELGGVLANTLSYATHATGVILRAYDLSSLEGAEEKFLLQANMKERGIVTVDIRDKELSQKRLSIVGVNQEERTLPNDKASLVLLEASYIHPDLLVEAVAHKEFDKDTLYYKTSRGSECNLQLGREYLFSLLEKEASMTTYSGHLSATTKWQPNNIALNAKEICSLIGADIETSRITTILINLQFEIHSHDSENFSVTVPRFRHDIKNIHDVTEEIVRIIGIDNIPAKALEFTESNRLTSTTQRYKFKKLLRHSAAAAGFYENISYIFSDKKKLEQYGFELVDAALDLANPIAEDLNTLRSTHMVNLLDAIERNVNYTQKSIGLFEIGAVFDTKREQKEILSLVLSGYSTVESIANSGKPPMVDFASFVQKIGAVVGNIELVACSQTNGLIHPYQSADILYRGFKCGYMTKLHPIAQEEYGIPDTFIAQIDMDALLPHHINATAISKFQGVYKDLSIVVEKSLPYEQIRQEIASLDLPLLQRYYPVDLYEDEELGDKKSLTLRLLIQSAQKTLKDKDIDQVISPIMQQLEQSCQAVLR